MTSKTEIWKSLPGVLVVEVSTLGNVRTLDRLVSTEKRTQFVKGHVLKQWDNGCGYLYVNIPMNGKWAMKKVHRLVAQTFLPNPDNLKQVNHKDNDRTNNNVSNLEFCTASYNAKYREKFGKASGCPVFAIDLVSLEVYKFRSQNEASRALGIFQQSISKVIKGKAKRAGGFWFVNADENADDAINRKLQDIKKIYS